MSNTKDDQTAKALKEARKHLHGGMAIDKAFNLLNEALTDIERGEIVYTDKAN
jgi:hypothetical protein